MLGKSLRLLFHSRIFHLRQMRSPLLMSLQSGSRNGFIVYLTQT